jgi:glycosyltransferase involved in cell wall biosynthesis
LSAEPAELAIVGAYPPPYGGMSLHVQRLCALLDARKLRYVVYNAGSPASGPRVRPVGARPGVWLIRYLLTAREPAVYLLTARLGTWVVGALLARLRGKRVAIRLRNAKLLDYLERAPRRGALAAAALRSVDAVVCVNPRLAEAVRGVGVASERIHVFEGFLPPLWQPGDRTGVPAALRAFADARDPLIVANGRVAWHRGEDLYGLDLLVDLAARLRADHPRHGIAVCFWDHAPEDEPYLEELRRRAAEAGAAEHLLFHTAPALLLPVLAAARLFVRPTRTDGDANSVREALYLGVPVVASDAAPRPSDARLFRSGDRDDLERAVREALREPRSRREEPSLAPEDRRRIERYLAFLDALARPGQPGRAPA